MNPDYQQSLAILQSFLDSPACADGQLDIDQLQGAMVAFSSSPEPGDRYSLGFLVMGDNQEAHDLWYGETEVRRAWVACFNSIDEALHFRNFNLLEMYGVDEAMRKPPLALQMWCDGYLRGYHSHEETWHEAHEFLATQNVGDTLKEHESMLSLMSVIATWEECLAEHEEPEKLQDNFLLIMQSINDGVWQPFKLSEILEESAVRAEEERQPYMRMELKVGRNDPCPCGSGKKYKKCCMGSD